MEEKDSMLLPDGRKIVGNPWIQPCFLRDGWLEIGFSTVYPLSSSGCKVARGNSLKLLKFKIPNNHYGIELPEINILNEKLWSSNLNQMIVKLLRQSDENKTTIEYIIHELIGKEKELALSDSHRLIGGLRFSLNCNKDSTGHDDLIVLGNIRSPEESSAGEETILFTIKFLYPHLWPGSSKRPVWTRNRTIWCKKLEFLVINYLNLLATFASVPLNSQISEIADDLASKSDWAVICRGVFRKLLALDPEARESEAIGQILELIEGTCHA